MLQGKETLAYSRGRGKELVLHNVSYSDEGLWRCTASNTIKGEERRLHSEVLRLGVAGRPMVMAEETMEVQAASLQEDKDIQVRRRAMWANKLHTTVAEKSARAFMVQKQSEGVKKNFVWICLLYVHWSSLLLGDNLFKARTILKNRMNSSFSLNHPGAIHPILYIVLVQNS